MTDAIARYLDNLDQVEGWGMDRELAPIFLLLNDLQRQFEIHGTLFEIGVHHGRTAILLALMARPTERCVFLDLFDHQEDNVDNSGRGDLEVFRKNLARWAPTSEPEIIAGNSLKLDLSSIPGLAAGVRFAHIDGGHYKSLVLNDLHKTEAVLGAGGVVVIDDFLHSGFLGVNEACNHYLREARGMRLSPVATGKNKLMLATRSHADRYREGLLGALTPQRRLAEFYGEQLVCLDRF